MIVGDVTYEAVWRLFSELLPQRYNIEATFVDMGDMDAVRAAVRPNTKLIPTETIANPATKVTDITARVSIASEAGALLSVDSTFTPPPFFRPLALGADLVIHSLTKYINGHGDAMGGVVIGSKPLIHHIKADALVDLGGTISPFNAWLIMRGSVTLPLRLKQQFSSAETVAQSLADDKRVAYVTYPGLDSHDQHRLAKDQFAGKGYGAVMAFAVDRDPDTQNRFVANLKIITSAGSQALPSMWAAVAAAALIVTRRTSRNTDICGFRSVSRMPRISSPTSPMRWTRPSDRTEKDMDEAEVDWAFTSKSLRFAPDARLTEGPPGRTLCTGLSCLSPACSSRLGIIHEALIGIHIAHAVGNHRNCDDCQRRAAVHLDKTSAARDRLYGLDRDWCRRLVLARNGGPGRAGVTHASGSGCLDRVGNPHDEARQHLICLGQQIEQTALLFGLSAWFLQSNPHPMLSLMDFTGGSL